MVLTEKTQNCRKCGELFSFLPTNNNRRNCDSCRQKNCEQCNIMFDIKPNAKKMFKFCSKQCYRTSKIGKPQNPEHVKKRAIANTGRKTGKVIKCFFCNEEKYLYPQKLHRSVRKFCTHSCFILWSRTSDNPSWKGDNYPENRRLRDSFKYKNWRRKVQKRDGFCCTLCGYKSEGTRPPDIQVDHIKSWALYPELRFEVSNGRVLCIPCHKTTDTWGVNAKFYQIPN